MEIDRGIVVFGFGSQAFVCGFSRQNICSVVTSNDSYLVISKKPGTVLLMQNVDLGQTKVMKIRQRETLSHEVCCCTAQYQYLVHKNFMFLLLVLAIKRSTTDALTIKSDVIKVKANQCFLSMFNFKCPN